MVQNFRASLVSQEKIKHPIRGCHLKPFRNYLTFSTVEDVLLLNRKKNVELKVTSLKQQFLIMMLCFLCIQNDRGYCISFLTKSNLTKPNLTKPNQTKPNLT